MFLDIEKKQIYYENNLFSKPSGCARAICKMHAYYIYALGLGPSTEHKNYEKQYVNVRQMFFSKMLLMHIVICFCTC